MIHADTCPPCRAGSLYGELARFVLRLLGYKQQPPGLQLQQKAAAGELPAPGQHPPGFPPNPPPAPGTNWDGVWGPS